MRSRLQLTAMLFVILASCVAYRVPYLSLDLKSEYDSSDIRVNYTYVCEYEDQRCVYSLWDRNSPSEPLQSEDKVMPSTGVLDFSSLHLGEGDYRLEFSVYSSRDGQSTQLKFLSESYDFTVDFP